MKDFISFLISKLKLLDTQLISLILLLACMGFILLLSAANGDTKWMLPQVIRFVVGFILMIYISMLNIITIHKYAWHFYIFTLMLLLLVELFGITGMGAKRWLDLHLFVLQPSELTKISTIILLSKMFANTSQVEISKPKNIITTLLIIMLPVYFVLQQPDLGTSIIIFMAGILLYMIAGLSHKYIISAGLIFLAMIPIVWNYALLDYQKGRILTFLNPERDPYGAGYHIIQSKIAIGSGGITGHGYMKGSQSQLNFLPEKHTDFIFTLLAEEFGMLGCIFLFIVLFMIMVRLTDIAKKCNSKFAFFMTIGISIIFSSYIFINTAMVMGLLPVVGVPLPLISYGGTVMMTTMIGFGLVLNAHINRDKQIN